eukprot:CAMPEP_0205918602 /NCGR_PEP_ID=MMETSP1325-20131115/9903_1 /ASSEMBLY_ACC=CAM_ASM_000708 /TAXON_ID=236786 /ORGANISM="Florenciella sp., Strain RCC1007" /LENGTH=57 /DNA_ID=CAMNT_0053286149 /DNA_START=224 /DNA_END=398 /DNA_ORIENTATION=-
MAGLDDQPPPLGIEAAHIVMAAASIGDGAHGDAEGAVLAREAMTARVSATARTVQDK